MTWIHGQVIQLLDRFDGAVDVAFPVAVGLLCFDQRTGAFLVLLVWLIWRLLQQIPRFPLATMFLLLLGAQAGQFILERDLQPSSPSDPLVIALGFVAMVGRNESQWRRTLAWIALAIIPLAIWAVYQDRGVALKLPVGGVNRLGFLLGMLQLSAWASMWFSRFRRGQIFYGALAIACVPMILLNGSRVTLVAPLCAVVGSVFLSLLVNRSAWLPLARLGFLGEVGRRRLLAMLVVFAFVLGVIAVQNWYLNPVNSAENNLSDRGRIETARCWMAQPFRRGAEKFLLGVGYNESLQRRCDGRRVKSLAEVGRPEGLPHAHNLFAQVFAENGLLGAISLAAVLMLLVGRMCASGAGGAVDERLLFAYCIPFLIYLLMNGLVSSFHLFLMSNQILIGVGLASLWTRSSIRSVLLDRISDLSAASGVATGSVEG